MKDETKLWLEYADENLKSSQILIKSKLYNPVLQNVQQSVEKYIKSLFIEKAIKLQKTHNITVLVEILKQNDIFLDIDENQSDLLDSIYLSSKYPFGSVLPDFTPDESICKVAINIALNVQYSTNEYLKD